METQNLEQPPQIRSTPYSSPMHNYGGSILLLTNPQNLLYKMELTLRSMIEDGDGNLTKVGEPLLNDLGISSVIGIVESIVNQDTVMSNLTKEDIEALRNFLADTLAKDLMINRIKYAIKTVSARDKIFFTVVSTSYICMRRAFEGDDKKFWKGSQQEITTRHEGLQSKGGLISKLSGWGKK
jgi:hypothetical protein